MKPAVVVSGRGCAVAGPQHTPSLNIRSPPPPLISSFTFGSRLQISLPRLSNPIQKSRTRLPIARAADRDYSVAEAPAKALRRILDLPGVHQGPACFDALSARLVERAGFQYCFTSGMWLCAFLFLLNSLQEYGFPIMNINSRIWVSFDWNCSVGLIIFPFFFVLKFKSSS